MNEGPQKGKHLVCGKEGEGVFLGVFSSLAAYKGNSRLSDGWSSSRMLKVPLGEKLAASDRVTADEDNDENQLCYSNCCCQLLQP